MARNTISRIGSLIDGFSAGYDMVGRVVRDRDLRAVATAKPTTDTGFTQAQGDQLNAAAESGQYDVMWDGERGHYTVRPKAQPVMEGVIEKPQPVMEGVVAPQQRTQFLGKTYDTPLDEQGVSRARQMAMAGVLEKHGDPTAGVRMRDMLRQGDIAEESLKLTRQRGEREAELAPLQVEQARLGVEGLRRAAGREQRVESADADLQKAWASRLANPDGSRRAATPDDHLWMTEQRIYKLSDAGDMKGAQEAMQAHAAQSLAKLTLDTLQRSAAVDKAVAGVVAGDFAGAMEVYNRFLPDGATVTSIKPGKNGSLIVEREAGGRKIPPQTLKSIDELRIGLETIKDPRAAWQMSMQLADQVFRQRADARAGAAHAAGAAQRQLSETLARLQTERLDPKTTPARRAEIDTLLAQGKGADTNEPADVKLARVAMNAGMFTDMRDALTWAVRNKDASPDKVKADLYAKALQTTGSAEAARKATEEGMAYLYPQGAAAATPAAAGAAVPPPAQRKPGQTYNTPQGPMIWRGTGWEQASARTAAQVAAAGILPGRTAAPPPITGPRGAVRADLVDSMPEGAELDAAIAASDAAYERMMGFGSRQRAADPEGFRQAQVDHATAKERVAEVRRRYEAAVGGAVRPAMVLPTP